MERYFHCTNRGYSSARTSPFRTWYKSLLQLRHLADEDKKLAVFTATATRQTKQRIFEVMGHFAVSTFCLERSPLKNNIKYAVCYISNSLKLETIFASLINEIMVSKENTKRTIRYCQTRTQCAVLRRMFMLKLGDSFYLHRQNSAWNRIVDMYHAGTPPKAKSFILPQAIQENSHMRILICTVAFGIGINCRVFTRIIHFGPSKNLESFVQECGRAGRNGEESVCYLLYNSLLASRSADAMKDFMYSTECRRRSNAKYFSNNTPSALSCNCCKICAQKCACDVNRSCQELLTFPLHENADMDNA